jgi:hypothetical protein
MALFAACVVALCRKLARRVGQAAVMAPHDRFGAEATFGFVILCFTINLTETFFFRGTDFTQVTLTFVTVLLFSKEAHGSRAAAETEALPRAGRFGVWKLRPGQPHGPGTWSRAWRIPRGGSVRTRAKPDGVR